MVFREPTNFQIIRMEEQLKSLVYDFLTETDTKVANLFRKNQKPKRLPTDSPKLKEIVFFYTMNSAKKGNKQATVDEVRTSTKKIRAKLLDLGFAYLCVFGNIFILAIFEMW